MGWFDDDDDDDDDNDDNENSQHKNHSRNHSENLDSADEEDPLDAYMKSLNNDEHATSSSQSRASAGGRLDHDAEEEATSHWESQARTSSRSSGGGGGRRLLGKPAGVEKDDDDDHFGMRSREARSAMSNTFVRAGGKKSVEVVLEPTFGDDDDDNDLERQRQMMKHQEIDPLERVDHGGIKYEPFRRQFYKPANTEAGAAWRKQHDVACNPPFDPVIGFGQLQFASINQRGPPKGDSAKGDSAKGDSAKGDSAKPLVEEDDHAFPPELLLAIAKAGYDSPTIVQSQTLPVALSGRDALVTASTGSGKTLAYLWPMIVHAVDQRPIVPHIDGPIGLVLTPTRELAKQVHKHAKLFVECVGGKAVEVAGGNRGTWELTKELKRGCEIVVSTPGRLIDMVKGKGTNLKRVTMIVLDEADRMLDMGFEKQVSSIMENIRPDRQTLLLSATFGKRVERVARSWLRNPVRIAVGRTGASSEHVDQHVMVLPSRDAKLQWLIEMLPILTTLGRCLVFVATRADCDLLTDTLRSPTDPTHADNAKIVSIHGDKDQRDRNSAISQFKKYPRSILIATDVAARGLDVPDVMTVINFDAAKNLDSHVHRIGRAGRLSKDTVGGEHRRGVAYTLLTQNNADFAQLLVEAFEKEGRTVSQEMVTLCQKSKRYGGGRGKNSKVGLGFGGEAGMSQTGVAQRNHRSDRGSEGGNYYGPTGGLPVTKRSRWG